jgi:hypothetical protein
MPNPAPQQPDRQKLAPDFIDEPLLPTVAAADTSEESERSVP